MWHGKVNLLDFMDILSMGDFSVEVMAHDRIFGWNRPLWVVPIRQLEEWTMVGLR